MEHPLTMATVMPVVAEWLAREGTEMDGSTARSPVQRRLAKLTGYSHAKYLNRGLREIGLFKDWADSQAAFAELQSRARCDDHRGAG